MTIDMRQFFQVFFDETEELLAEMEKLLLSINLAAPDEEELNAIFRAAHSIKGGAGTFGITDLTDITHELETLLDLIRKGEMGLTAKHVDAFLEAKDILKMQLDGHRLHTPVNQETVTACRCRLQALAHFAGAQPSQRIANQSTSSSPAGTRRLTIALPSMPPSELESLSLELATLGMLTRSSQLDGKPVLTLDTTSTIDDVAAICMFLVDPKEMLITEDNQHIPGAAETDAGFGFFEPMNVDQLAGSPLLAAHELATEKAREQAQGYGFFAPFTTFVAPEAPAVIHHDAPEVAADMRSAANRREPERATASSESTSIRVSIEKVDQLINLVGELVITQAMLEQRTDKLDPMLHERLLNSVTQLTRNTRDLQEAVMSIRMMPMDYVFSRFPRMVRDLAGKLGKKVEFVTIGAATELDKGLIERIIDPLTHLVRNSIDHGIELPAQRAAAGKNETGRLSLSASHQGGNIVIEVTDDGGGLSRERILGKAVESGLPVSDAMPDAEVWQLIFAPGFTTAEEVTDISGRGVGMDVVKRNIGSLGGSVDIRSAAGFGTTISISLPLTLAILDGMSVRVGEEIYILPLGYVIESLQPEVIDVKGISGQGRVIKVRGEYLPLIALHEIFGITPQHQNPSDGIVVILESDGRKAALFVDDLVGQQQVVVKNLESNYRKVAGISGATILGDGGVSLIVDVSTLIRSSQRLADETLFSS